MKNIGFELSPSQKRLWLFIEKGFSLNNAITVRINEALDISKLNEAILKVVERHEIIRTNFLPQANISFPIQSVTACESFSLKYFDLSVKNDVENVVDIVKKIIDKLSDYDKSLLLDATLIKEAQKSYILVLTMPSLSSDLDSLKNIIHETMYNYAFPFQNQDDVFQFAQYAEWHNELLQNLDDETDAFLRKQNFSEYLNVKLPLEVDNNSKKTIETVECTIDSELVEKLNFFSGKFSCTFSSLLLSCWSVFTWRLLNCPENIVIGYVESGRTYESFSEINGPLSKTLPIHLHLLKDQKIAELVKTLSGEIESIKDWNDSFNWDLYNKSTIDVSKTPFFPICFEYNFLKLEDLNKSNLSYSVEDVYSVNDFFKLKLCCNQFEDSLKLNLYYLTTFFDSQSVECLKSQFIDLLKEFVQQPDQKNYDLLKSSPREIEQLRSFNTNTTLSFEKSIVEEFEKQAQQNSKNIASSGEIELSYEDLNKRANQFGAFIKSNFNVDQGDIIAISIPRSVNQIAIILGVLKIGATYLPIDISTPEQRLKFVLDDCNAKLLVIEQDYIISNPLSTSVLKIDAGLSCVDDKESDNHLVDIDGKDIAYIIYTSGTTGNPKGVKITHRSLMNYIEWFKTAYLISDKDSSMLVSSIAFDLCYTALWPSLVLGGTLYLLEDKKYFDAELLLRGLIENKTTYLKLTPSHFNLLINTNDFASKVNDTNLRLIVLGGEEIRVNDIEKFFTFRHDVTFVNHYGPTETTIGTIAQKIDFGNFNQFKLKPVIGRPITNNRVYVLTDNMELAPIGISGQIGVCGEGVADGYLNRDELSKEKFKNDLLENEGRIYLTGDVGRWLANGTIEFLGRNDNQIKVRGYRIELQEIDAVLKKHPDIKDIVTLITGEDERELKTYFVAYVKLDIKALRKFAGENLPEYMIPQFFEVNKIPLNNNGKVDRNKLLTLKSVSEQALEAPKNDTERQLVDIWKEVMSLDVIGIKDSFFELGGHSLKAVQIVSRVNKAFKTKIELKDIFEKLTIENLAKLFAGNQNTGVSEIKSIEEQEYYSVSNAQKRLWVIDQLEKGFNGYNMVSAFSLDGKLDTNAFKKAFEKVINRHESLRTVFKLVNGEPTQIILHETKHDFELDVFELQEKDFNDNIKIITQREAHEPFNLKTGPLLRAKLIGNSCGSFVFLFTMHHIVSDGWSVKLLIKEITQLYDIYANGKENDLPLLNIQYKDYTAWQNTEVKHNYNRHKQFWAEKFKGTIPVLNFPTDFNRPAIKTYNGDSIQFLFDEDLTKSVKNLARRYDTTVFTVLIASIKALLNRYTEQNDIIIGIPIAERTNQALESQIGLYLNNISLRTGLSAEDSFDHLLSKIKSGLFDAYEHQIYPFDMLVEDLNLKRDRSRSPLFDIVVLKNSDYEEKENGIDGIYAERIDSGFRVSTIDLRIVFNEGSQYITGVIDFNTDLFIKKSIIDFSENLKRLMVEVVENTSIKIEDINLGFKNNYTHQILHTKFNY